jgi:cytochrome c6
MIKKLGSLILLMLTLLAVVFTNPVWAVDQTEGAQIFAQNCAACHANGGNIIRRGKNLKKRALQRHKKDSIEAISTLVTQGKYAMPAYADRLSEEQIEAVAAYVLEQAENNWQ